MEVCVVKLSSLDRAIAFVKASTRFALSGFHQVSEEEQAKRIAICIECPFFNDTNPDDPLCNHCSCHLNLKSQWATEKCPINKW